MNHESLAALMAEITSVRYETTLPQLAKLLEIDSNLGVLGQIAVLGDTLKTYNIQVIPNIDKGEVDSTRLLRIKTADTDPLATLQRDLQSHESQEVEFKSTFQIDIGRLKATNKPINECKSEVIIFETLTAIAAFLNTDGGCLYIGVTDKKDLIGLSDYDFQIASTTNQDQFEKILRDHLQGKFKDGQTINDFVSIKFIHPENGKIIALIEVLPRSALSFLKINNQFLLYKRQGNRSLLISQHYT